MLIALGRGEPPDGGRRDPTITVCLVWIYTMEMFAQVGDGPAAQAAGTIAWVLMVLMTLAEH